MIYELFVEGEPVPQGSMSAFPYEEEDEAGEVSLHVRQTHSRDDLNPWRDLIGYRWRAQFGVSDLTEPLFAFLKFYCRPFKSAQRMYPTSQRDGDLDKLARGVYDALEGILYRNDAQVIVQVHRQVYALELVSPPGVQIVMAPWAEVCASDLMGLFRGESLR